jgi:formate dehydrogenase maturation protein FdhE
MKAATAHIRHHARHRFGAWLAIAAMVLQVMFGTAHAASMAAAAFGPLVIERSSALAFDLLQICSANGLIEIRSQTTNEGGQTKQENTAKDRCPVCGSASVSPAIAAAAVDVEPAPFLQVLVPLALEQGVVVTRCSHRHPIRGPPLA